MTIDRHPPVAEIEDAQPTGAAEAADAAAAAREAARADLDTRLVEHRRAQETLERAMRKETMLRRRAGEEADPEAAALLDAATLDRIFDLEAALRNAGAAFDRLEAAHV